MIRFTWYSVRLIALAFALKSSFPFYLCSFLFKTIVFIKLCSIFTLNPFMPVLLIWLFKLFHISIFLFVCVHCIDHYLIRCIPGGSYRLSDKETGIYRTNLWCARVNLFILKPFVSGKAQGKRSPLISFATFASNNVNLFHRNIIYLHSLPRSRTLNQNRINSSQISFPFFISTNAMPREVKIILNDVRLKTKKQLKGTRKKIFISSKL